MTNCTGEIVARNQGLEVMDCKPCGYAHLHPKPDAAAVDAYYTSDQFYSTHSPRDWFEREYKEHRQGLWSSYYTWESWQFPRGCAITDIGAGCGWFGMQIGQYRNLVYSVEPSESARLYGIDHGARNMHRTLVEVKKTQPPWTDNSTRARLVLEHLVDPGAFLDKCAEFTGPDGVLEVVIPSEFNPLQTKMRKVHGDWFVQQPHINYFTGKSLTRLLRGHGWEVVKVGATYPIELRWHLGDRYIGDDQMGHRLHMQRLDMEKKLGPRIFNVYTRLYKWFGWGREAIVFARRV